MKKFILLCTGLLTISIALVTCKKDNKSKLPKTETSKQESLHTAKIEQAKATYTPQLMRGAAITYKGALCHEVTVSGTTPGSTIFTPAAWNFWSFTGKAGDIVTIYAPRTGNCHMDPSFTLYYGITNDATGLYPFDIGGSLTWLAFKDDEAAKVCVPSGDCFADPKLNKFELPFTGSYTVAVQNFNPCTGGPYTYNLSLTFNSIINPVIAIGSCNSGVKNKFINCNTRMSDAISACLAEAKNHGSFVSSVSHLVNMWRKAGLITGAEGGAIIRCAASSDLP